MESGEQAAATGAERHERDLIARVASCDRAAFECLYRRYRPRLLRFSQRMAQSPATVEEILNDTMLVVWRRAGTYNGTCKVSTWIFAIAYRLTLKALRHLDDPVDGASEDSADEAAAGPEGRLIATQQAAGLRTVLAQLSPDQRAVVDLAYFQDFSYQEIASVLACPVDTVKTRMFHARRKLRLLLDAQNQESA
jgi:RNA polymerase sigma-70 factor (ECF subfamily)